MSFYKALCRLGIDMQPRFASASNSISVVLTLLFTSALLVKADISGYAFPDSVNGWLTNNCAFPIYVWTDAAWKSCSTNRDGPPCSSDEWIIHPGGTYKVPYQAIPLFDDMPAVDRGGVTLKIATKPAKYTNTPVYEAEWSIDRSKGIIWYNFSHEDAQSKPEGKEDVFMFRNTWTDVNPFKGYARYMQIGGKGMCEDIFCPPGSNECDWDLLDNVDFQTARDGRPSHDTHLHQCPLIMDVNVSLC
ncbi:hypothetical protein EJ08DRAFT_645171 [Tothia fuscella]|uniref:Uncharacterized protein n=1 Tax=Tothia fuscella TaxID=1048955 RepID=A0A9P4P3N3_9PEZI|nr:hypothetical protein EJ08DRAFT_645171 [Tothia fuscella]